MNNVLEIERILRVDHAGENGAINIYKAQLLISKILYPDLVPALETMLLHENKHFHTFDQLLKKRQIRHCYALHLWAMGGFSLGILTALLGRKSIGVCTDAIETTVLHHLDTQLDYLTKHDKEAYNAVRSIKADEESHQKYGKDSGSNSVLYKPIYYLVKHSTGLAIWLSTKL